MSCKSYHYYSTSDWVDQGHDMKLCFKTINSTYSEKAAKGEGAGGTGLETFVHFLIENPIVTGITTAVIYDLIKKVVTDVRSIEPIEKSKQHPEDTAIPEYMLLVYIGNSIINIPLYISNNEAGHILRQLKNIVPIILSKEEQRIGLRVYYNRETKELEILEP